MGHPNRVGDVLSLEAAAPEQRECRRCVECHREIVVAFTGTRMAEAASGAAYLDEWVGKGGRLGASAAMRRAGERASSAPTATATARTPTQSF
jgi:hypothetical protein